MQLNIQCETYVYVHLAAAVVLMNTDSFCFVLILFPLLLVMYVLSRYILISVRNRRTFLEQTKFRNYTKTGKTIVSCKVIFVF